MSVEANFKLIIILDHPWKINQCHLQRWNAIKSEKAKYNPSYPFLFPRPYEGLYEPVREVLRSQADNVNCQVR